MIAHTPTTPALTLPLRAPRAVPRASVLAAENAPRFTVDGSMELEMHLARTCDKIAAGIRGLLPHGKLEAVLLGGGYGRGEGGVLRTATGDRPYNDLEFYVCLRGNRHLNEWRFGRALHVLGEILTPQAGVEVEFKITSLAELRRTAISMFSYDLVLGHRWLVGDESRLAGCGHHRAAAEIPLGEATRLLMNRCTGLLLAEERLRRKEFTAADADFVARNLAKAGLALGDAVLVSQAQYHWSARERQRLLERFARTATPLPWLQDVCRHHAHGVEFKLHPQRSTASRDTLRAAHAPVVALAAQVWLWIESRRLGTTFTNISDYALQRGDRWPTTTPVRNALVQARALGWRSLVERRGLRHPRGRVLRALSLLLWEPRALQASACLACLQAELRTSARDFTGLMTAYRALWSRVH